jgi:DNA-binding NarL/FixJ family response regulator
LLANAAVDSQRLFIGRPLAKAEAHATPARWARPPTQGTCIAMDGIPHLDSVVLDCSNTASQNASYHAASNSGWREEAADNDARDGAALPLALFWQALTGGVCRVVDTFFTSRRCYVVTAERKACGGPPVRGRRLKIVERILSGCAQKEVALELGLAASTVANDAKAGLASLGITARPSRAHPVLMLAAKAASDADLSLIGSSCVARAGVASLRVIGIARPEVRLSGVLTSAELAVLPRLIEGHSYEDIARERGTSRRTVANQIASVFQRLHVSGRNELVHRLFAERARKAASSWPLALSWADWAKPEMVAS